MRAFTLIELLIVVAIIAILAAIAVPNFLEAQTRSKVSRMKADLRTLATAVEAYAVDNNAYPPHRADDGGEIGYPERYVPLTTPVAYIASIPARDVFHQEDVTGQGGSLEWVSWTNIDNFPATHALDPARDTHRWMLRSRGPDGLSEANDVRNAFLVFGLALGPSMLYDPTNGTVSRGDIVRTAILSP
ncbi:MAG TPA: prepilin-type N-terminal cleavage/methylation domain-containing protein [Candidatus Sumerlaeota bacterium]|nr:prepilin-type N-terminal cleavage/methylation domain-containing protein [Candidatus Sumerlaeota bacterium]